MMYNKYYGNILTHALFKCIVFQSKSHEVHYTRSTQMWLEMLRNSCFDLLLYRYIMYMEIPLVFISKYISWFFISQSWYCLKLLHVPSHGQGTTLQAPCSQSFSGSGSRSGSRFKMNNFWTITIICSRKLDVCIHWHSKCCFRPKMHKIKVHVGVN